MRRLNSGFTLIEAMIVVAIIGLLAAVAIPLYQGNLLKSQVNRAVSELGTYKSVFEIQVASGGTVKNLDLGYVPSNLTDGAMAKDIAAVNPDGSGRIEVTLGGSAHSHLTGVVIRYVREPVGRWVCEIDISAASSWRDAYGPTWCRVL